MKLVSFRVQHSTRHLHPASARYTVQRVVDLNMAYVRLLADQQEATTTTTSRRRRFRATMLDFLEGGPSHMAAARRALDYAMRLGSVMRRSAEETFLCTRAPSMCMTAAPLPNPPSLRDFIAFEDHIAATSKKRGQPIPPEWYKAPVYYKGNHRTIIGPDEALPWPLKTTKLDYELELACVIGRRGRDIAERNAGHYIAGYTIMNDFSARDIQFQEMACRLGPAKGKDFATAIGPCLVTPDEILDSRVA